MIQNLRIGNGFDVHAFTDGNKLILGGIEIPSDKGVIAHSDGDVLIHALIDALLGAAGLGDIGMLFPDTDPQYKNISSSILLEKTLELFHNQGFELINIDCTILLQSPKIASFLKDIKSRLARVCQLPEEVINIKAGTTEKLGFIGRSDGIAALVSVLAYKSEKLNP